MKLKEKIMAKILIADDALFMRKLLADILVNHGHEIIGEASTAKEAIALYEELKPDLLTLDIIMPEDDDITTTIAIKEIIETDKNANIIIVSAIGQQQIIDETLQAGARDFIIKPFQKEKVINTVNKFATI